VRGSVYQGVALERRGLHMEGKLVQAIAASALQGWCICKQEASAVTWVGTWCTRSHVCSGDA